MCEVLGSCCGVEASGEADDERVERLFPSLGSGAEFFSSVVSDVADGQVEDLEYGIAGGEMPPSLGDLAELIVQRFNSVCGVHDLAVRGVESQERGEPFPVPSPQIDDGRILVSPFGVEFVVVSATPTTSKTSKCSERKPSPGWGAFLTPRWLDGRLPG